MFSNNLLANTKLSKTQLHKIGESGGFLGRRLGSLLKNGLTLMTNVASAADATIQPKLFGSRE